MTSISVQNFLGVWHLAIAKRDLGILDPWVTDEVVLVSPALFRPKVGKRVVTELLLDVLASFESYQVTKAWIDGNEILLEFDAKVKGKSLQGIDRITLNSEGRMTHLKVYIRPFKGLKALISSVVELNIGRLRGPRKLIARIVYALKTRS